jgi:hypothetical protein
MFVTLYALLEREFSFSHIVQLYAYPAPSPHIHASAYSHYNYPLQPRYLRIASCN